MMALSQTDIYEAMELRATVARLESEVASLRTTGTRRSVLDAIRMLLASRKFLILLFDTVVSLSLYYNAVDPVLIGILQAPVLFVIGGIAYEDGSAKSSPNTTVINSFPTTNTTNTTEAP
jgi:hypothetical protein